MIDELEKLNKKQKDLMKQMGKEKCDDIDSVLIARNLADGIIELEIKMNLLITSVNDKSPALYFVNRAYRLKTSEAAMISPIII